VPSLELIRRGKDLYLILDHFARFTGVIASSWVLVERLPRFERFSSRAR